MEKPFTYQSSSFQMTCPCCGAPIKQPMIDQPEMIKGKIPMQQPGLMPQMQPMWEKPELMGQFPMQSSCMTPQMQPMWEKPDMVNPQMQYKNFVPQIQPMWGPMQQSSPCMMPMQQPWEKPEMMKTQIPTSPMWSQYQPMSCMNPIGQLNPFEEE